MQREVDTTRERMERLQSIGCADYLHMALLDRAERAEAERDAAFAAGQESMRERAALEAERGLAIAPKRDGEMMQAIAEGIRDIPIKPRP